MAYGYGSQPERSGSDFKPTKEVPVHSIYTILAHTISTSHNNEDITGILL